MTGVTVRGRLFGIKWQAGPASQADVIDGALPRLSFEDGMPIGSNLMFATSKCLMYKMKLLHVVLLWHFTSVISSAELFLLSLF